MEDLLENIKFVIIGTHHNDSEYQLIPLLNKVADFDPNTLLFTESSNSTRPERNMEDIPSVLLYMIIEFILVAADPLCIIPPICHGYCPDITYEEYVKTTFESIVWIINYICKNEKKCPPEYDYRYWYNQYKLMEDPNYKISIESLLEKYINPVIEWLRYSDIVDMSDYEWEQLYQQIDYITYNKLCEEDREIIRDLLDSSVNKIRERRYAKIIYEAVVKLLNKPIKDKITIYVQMGTGHSVQLIKELRNIGIDLTEPLRIRKVITLKDFKIAQQEVEEKKILDVELVEVGTNNDLEDFIKKYIPIEYRLIGKWVEKVLQYGTTDIITDAGDFIKFEQDSNKDPYFSDMTFKFPFYVKLIRKDDISSLEYLYNKLISDGMINKSEA